MRADPTNRMNRHAAELREHPVYFLKRILWR